MKLIATSERGDQLVIPVAVALEKGTLHFRLALAGEEDKPVGPTKIKALFKAKHGYKPKQLSFSWGGE